MDVVSRRRDREEMLNLLSEIEKNTSKSADIGEDMLTIALEEQQERNQREAIRGY